MRRTIIFPVVIVLIAAALTYYFLSRKGVDHDAIVLYGNVDVRQVDLGFRVNGRVSSLLFEEGHLVPKGALMAEIEKQPYGDQMLQAQAAVQSIKTNFTNAERLLKRRQELIADGSVSQEDLDNALSTRDALAANLKQAEAALGVSKKNLDDTKVFAPTEGTILTRIREPGTVVKEGDAVYTLSITSPVWIRAYITEELLGVVYPGMTATIHTDTKDGPSYTGKVGFISPVAEFTPKTVETSKLRTDLVYRIRVYADNPDKGLRQGMPVTLKLQRKQ